MKAQRLSGAEIAWFYREKDHIRQSWAKTSVNIETNVYLRSRLSFENDSFRYGQPQWRSGEYQGPLQSQILGPKSDLTRDYNLASVRLWAPLESCALRNTGVAGVYVTPPVSRGTNA
ncbi:hypothetical protein TNCV_3310681 [Trichonephila clavipes]|nr:hypothetical protein TNCV_3310681 [Trichonephila clavipes]